MPIPCNHACRRLTLPLLAIAAALLCANGVSAQDAEGSKLPGFSDTPPKSGPVIETDRGYMIPYKATIPGTTVTFEMLPIPCGVFKLGSPDGEKGRAKNEGPQVEIEVAPFWMGKHEVSWNEYERYMEQHRLFRNVRRLREAWQFDEAALSYLGVKVDDRIKPLFEKARKDEAMLASLPDKEKQTVLRLLEFAKRRDALVAALKKPENASLAKQLEQDVKHTDYDAVTAPTQLYDVPTVYQDVTDKAQPATMMTHYAARQYTKWLSKLSGVVYRLPSEAEWEYACRAGTKTAFSFGNDPKQLRHHAWTYANSDERTHTAGGKRANPWGLYDMHGNVGEWVLDELVDDQYAKLAARGAGPVKAWDAVAWPKKLYPRVVRGGGWDSDPEQCRSAARLGSDDDVWKGQDPGRPSSPWWFTDDPARAVGFRLVRPLDPPSEDDLKKCWDADTGEVIKDVTYRLNISTRGDVALVGPDLPQMLERAKALEEELDTVSKKLIDAYGED
jgi:formylglycine-generating enzyme required for sulfatase activity